MLIDGATVIRDSTTLTNGNIALRVEGEFGPSGFDDAIVLLKPDGETLRVIDLDAALPNGRFLGIAPLADGGFLLSAQAGQTTEIAGFDGDGAPVPSLSAIIEGVSANGVLNASGGGFAFVVRNDGFRNLAFAVEVAPDGSILGEFPVPLSFAFSGGFELGDGGFFAVSPGGTLARESLDPSAPANIAFFDPDLRLIGEREIGEMPGGRLAADFDPIPFALPSSDRFAVLLFEKIDASDAQKAAAPGREVLIGIGDLSGQSGVGAPLTFVDLSLDGDRIGIPLQIIDLPNGEFAFVYSIDLINGESVSQSQARIARFSAEGEQVGPVLDIGRAGAGEGETYLYVDALNRLVAAASVRDGDARVVELFTIDLGIDPPEPTGPSDGDDTIDGTAGSDVFDGLGGDDLITGLAGADTLIGGDGADTLDGGGGRDDLSGGRGSDSLNGGGGKDTLSGGGQRDELLGGGGADSLSGGGGRDVIVGGGGRDRLFGDGGADRLLGSKGADVMSGGGGRDVFQFNAGDGADRIVDFAQGRDRIEFLSGAESVADLRIAQAGADVLITHVRGSIRVEGADAGDFSAADFLF